MVGRGPGILQIPRVLSLDGMKASVREQRNLNADVISCHLVECISVDY
jgi:hypothetical protein